MSPTNYAVPTGSFLNEWLEENQMTRADLARRLGASRKHVSQMVSGKVPLSYELAENLELVTGVPARIWNNYELQYQSDLARLRKDSVLKARFSDVMRFPIDYLRRRGHITSPPSDHAGVMRELLGFFNVADIDSLLAYAPQPLAAYRQAQAFEADDYAVATWIQCGVHDPAALRAALPKLRDLTLAEDFGQAIVDIAADAGVVVIVDPAPHEPAAGE